MTVVLAPTQHPAPLVSPPVRWVDPRWSVPAVEPDHPAFVRAAGHFARRLPPAVHDALVDFADEAPPSAALLLRGVPIGEVPATPPAPTAPNTKDHVSEFVLLAVARRLGQPVGYLPELGGRIVQNILPVAATSDRQVSTSSKVELMFHTEAAFHPHRPRYLLLLCLRGDPAAATTLTSILAIQDQLSDDVRHTLFEPRFRTAVDESYLAGGSNRLGPPRPVLSGRWERPTLVFDADLMVATDPVAQHALDTLREAVVANQTAVVLEPGDLLVVDNHLAVHGRRPFTPRFDGTDRWVQRAFVVSDHTAIGDDLDGRVVTTSFV